LLSQSQFGETRNKFEGRIFADLLKKIAHQILQETVALTFFSRTFNFCGRMETRPAHGGLAEAFGTHVLGCADTALIEINTEHDSYHKYVGKKCLEKRGTPM
jgi:hypothetical protein